MDADLGRRIKRAREAKRLNGKPLRQEDMAAKLGVSVRTVGRWEREGTVPRSALGALEVMLAPYFTVDDGAPEPPADPREREIYYLLLQQIENMTHAEALAIIEETRRYAKRATA